MTGPDEKVGIQPTKIYCAVREARADELNGNIVLYGAESAACGRCAIVVE